MTIAFVALGSNLKQPANQIQSALAKLAALPATELLCHSRLYKNPPIGIVDQPDFVNAVAKINTDLPARILLKELLVIEDRHQRIRKEKNGPRTLDLDLLLYGDMTMNTSDLKIPHPRMKDRPFVILPLAEIEPALILPCGSEIQTLLNDCNTVDLACIGEE